MAVSHGLPTAERTGRCSGSRPLATRAMPAPNAATSAPAARQIPKDLRGAIPATAFTMSIQTMPAGNRIPIHCHETEEIFFILEGECLVRCWEGGESCDIRLGRWDLVALPPFLNHEIFNDGAGDCHVQTLLAKPQPLRPQYADPELLELQAAQG